MARDKEVAAAHRRLSNSSVKFLDFIERNPDCSKISNYNLLELNDELFKLQPWPTFIDGDMKEEMAEAGIKIFDIIKTIPKRVFANDPVKINRYYEIPLEIVEYQLTGANEKHIENLFARGDFILSSGGLKCLEYNVSANLGGWDVPMWESLYLRTPMILRFIRENNIRICHENLISALLNHLIKVTSAGIGSDGVDLNIAVVMPREPNEKDRNIEAYMNRLYEKRLRFDKKKAAGEILFCTYYHLKIDNGYIFLNDKKIGVLIELHHGFVPREIMDVFKLGHVEIFNGPITGLLSNKLNLALLSELGESDIFNAGEKEAIKKYIPWTRKIASSNTVYDNRETNLVEFILNEREKLIIKPSAGYGGKGVHIGKNVPRKEWERLIEIALIEKNWVVQEYVESLPYLYQQGVNGYAVCDAAWGFFILGSGYCGGWVRVLPREGSKGVINCHQGATISVIFNTAE